MLISQMMGTWMVEVFHNINYILPGPFSFTHFQWSQVFFSSQNPGFSCFSPKSTLYHGQVQVELPVSDPWILQKGSFSIWVTDLPPGLAVPASLGKALYLKAGARWLYPEIIPVQHIRYFMSDAIFASFPDTFWHQLCCVGFYHLVNFDF